MFEDGRVGGIGNGPEAIMPTDAEMKELEDKIKEQGNYIRDLKENKGMTNDVIILINL